MLSDKLNCRLNLIRLSEIGMRKNDRRSIGDLIIVELTEVLHIHFTLINVGNGGKAIKLRIRCFNRLYCLDNVRELSYTAGLNDNTVGVELVKHLHKSLGEITDQRATDTAGVHLGNLDACILKETAVDADLSEFVFYKHKLFTAVCFLDELLYERGLTCSEEA